jgi:hypothetical protein
MQEIKIPKIDIDALGAVVQRAGLVAMSAAMTLSLLELQDDTKKVVMPTQPVPIWSEAGQNNDNNPIRREREETAPHFISYSEVQRTPSRSGRG